MYFRRYYTMLNLMKKSAPATTKTAVQITPNQKATTTVANVAGKVKTGAFGVATGAGIAGTMMLQNEKSIRNRKAREAHHKRVEQVCTVAVGAAVVGAGAAIVQSIFDPVIDVSMLEIEPTAYVELNDKGSEIQEKAAQKSEAADPVEGEDPAETVEGDGKKENAAPVPAPKAEQPAVEAPATEGQTPDPKDGQPASADPAPVAPKTEQPVASAPKDATPAPAPVATTDPAPVATAGQTNQGNNAQQPKSDAGKQQPKDNGQGASNNNPKNGNNHAKAAK